MLSVVFRKDLVQTIRCSELRLLPLNVESDYRNHFLGNDSSVDAPLLSESPAASMFWFRSPDLFFSINHRSVVAKDSSSNTLVARIRNTAGPHDCRSSPLRFLPGVFGKVAASPARSPDATAHIVKVVVAYGVHHVHHSGIVILFCDFNQGLPLGNRAHLGTSCLQAMSIFG